MNYSNTIYGPYYVNTSYTIQDIKEVITRCIFYNGSVTPAHMSTLVIRDAESNAAVVGCEDDTYYQDLRASEDEMEKINKALAEMLLDKKIYIDYSTGKFKLW